MASQHGAGSGHEQRSLDAMAGFIADNDIEGLVVPCLRDVQKIIIIAPGFTAVDTSTGNLGIPVRQQVDLDFLGKGQGLLQSLVFFLMARRAALSSPLIFFSTTAVRSLCSSSNSLKISERRSFLRRNRFSLSSVSRLMSF